MMSARPTEWSTMITGRKSSGKFRFKSCEKLHWRKDTEMRTNVESIQPGRKLEGKRIFPIFGALVAAMMLATPAPAETNAVADALWASVDQLVEAAVAAGGGDSTTALSALDTAESLLSQAKAALSSSGFDPVKFGKKIDGANKKLVGLQSYLGGSKWSEKSAVSKLGSAAKSLQSLANLAGSPLLVEVNAKTAGFHKAGTVVPMAFAIPEGCTDWEITCTETVLGSGVVADFLVDDATGEILVTLGSTRGSARVAVTGCGLPPGGKGWLLYNYGAKPVAGLPDGFPQNLPSGTYLMTYSWSVASITCCSGGNCTTTPGYSVPSTSLGTVPLTNLKTFAKILVQAFNAAVAAATTPGCSQSVGYSPFADDAFTVTYTVTCTSPGCTGGATTFSFTLQKQ